MSGAFLNEEDRSHLVREMRRQKNSAVHRRMNVLLLLDDGWSAARISEALYIDATTVGEHRALYESQGIAGIGVLRYSGSACALDETQREALAAWIDKTVPQTSKEVCAWVKVQFGEKYTPNALSKLLRRLGFVHRKPATVPAKADEAVQRAFVEETLAPLMKEAGPDKPLYFLDATHPAYTGRPAYGWIRRGRRLALPSNHGRTRLNINGALCWPERTVLHRFEEKITSAAQIKMLDEIAARHPKAKTITVIMDNAKYNISREMKTYFARDGCRIKPLYLPSYAPNLNLIERFWGFMKRTVLANRYYETFRQFQQAFDAFFDTIKTKKDALRSLLSDRFHFIGDTENRIPAA